MSETKMLQERLRSLAHPAAEAMADDKRLTLLIHAANDARAALDAKDALLREAQEVLSVFADYPVSSIGMDLDGYVIKLAVGGQQPAFGDFDRARALLLKLTEAQK